MSWNWLTFWLRRKKSCTERGAPALEDSTRGASAPRLERSVVMYTRQGCHLCEEAWQQLKHAQKRYGFTLGQVDIDDDPQLVRDYGDCVPVVTIDGKVRFRGVVNRVLLERLLSR